MHHVISVDKLQDSLGAQVSGMVKAVETCVHCGFCLPTCPTYQVLGEEMDSPRGRIVLMKSILEGEVDLAEALPFIDRCLGCQACVTSCPSGVQYGALLVPFRSYAHSHTEYPIFKKIRHNLIKENFPNPQRFKKAVSIGIISRPFGNLMPSGLRDLLSFLPDRRPVMKPLPEITQAQGARRARVALLAGCVQQALDPEINWATLRVLAKNGVEVLVPSGQVCCGAVLMHSGEIERARELAEVNFSAFSIEVDAILTNAAGCGSGLRDYMMLYQGLEKEVVAGVLAEKAMDVSQFLDQIGLLNTPGLPQPLRVAYHDACHLAHAQGITDAPRRLLSSIPNLSLIEIEESSMCCGSAGTYNLEQPEIARELGRRKALHILESGAEAIAMGNIGCMMQIRASLSVLNKILPVFHTIEILDMAFSQQ